MLGPEDDAHAALAETLIKYVTAADGGTARNGEYRGLVIIGTDSYVVLIAAFTF